MRRPTTDFPTPGFIRAQRARANAATAQADDRVRGGKGSVGLALYGGGNHAFLTANGTLRGLETHRLPDGRSPVEALAYMSSNSGGSWFNFAFNFAGFDQSVPGGGHTAPFTLLDVRTNDGAPTVQPYPDQITSQDVNELAKTSLAYSLILDPSWHVLFQAVLVQIIGKKFPFHHAWMDYVAQLYLVPHGVPVRRMLAESESAAQVAVLADPSLSVDDFTWPRRGPTPVAVLTMVAPANAFTHFTKGALATGKYLWENNLGGKPGFINTDGFESLLGPSLQARQEAGGITAVPFTVSTVTAGTWYERHREGTPYQMGGGSGSCASEPLYFPMTTVPPHKFVLPSGCALCCVSAPRLTVKAVVGASSSAYEAADGAMWAVCKPCSWWWEGWMGSLAVKLNTDVTPRAQRAEQLSGAPVARTLNYGDGVIVDNTAIIPQLQRNVEHILFPNTPYSHYTHIYAAARAGGGDASARLPAWIAASPFGTDFWSLFGWVSGAPIALQPASYLISHVFEDGHARLLELMVHLDKLYEAGLPMVYTLKRLRVAENPFWGTEPYECSLTVIFYYLAPAFGRAVGEADNGVEWDEAKGQFRAPYQDVPTLKMVGQDLKSQPIKFSGGCIPRLNLDGYTNGQINLSNYLATWTVDQAWGPLMVDGQVVFEGIGPILERAAAAAPAGPAAVS